ncbi:MAG: NHLP bacteriocin system secretion protein [Gammaproteobacteria bacterium]|nr:NHLP bacteriocin system secretion protein [Gammaproteobacteria bacterium]
MSQNRLFSKKALKNLSSPEELDKVMVISSSSSWLALWAFILFLIVVIIWGFIGRIPDTVTSQGIILNKDGEQAITASSAGKIKTINTAIGNSVKQGDIIATIAQPESTGQLKQYEEELKQKKNNHHELNAVSQSNLQNKQNNLSDKKRAFESELNDNKRILKHKKRTYQQMHKVEKTGVFSKNEIDTAKEEVDKLQEEIDSLTQQIEAIKTKKADNFIVYQEDKKNREYEEKQLSDKITLLKQKIVLSIDVLAPADGKIIGINVKVGSEVNPQTAIAQISLIKPNESQNNILKLYASPFQGDKVKAGHKVRFSPSFVVEQEYGYILGEVISIDRYPLTSAELLNDLNNEELIRLFQKSAGGPPIRIICRLQHNSSTYNGYVWSTKNGPPVIIPAGTLGNGIITVAKQRPIELVIPWLKKKTGL